MSMLVKYDKFGEQKGWAPATAQQLVYVLVGPVGSGKSSFLGSNPEAWIWDAEKRMHEVVHCRARVFSGLTMEEYIDMGEMLIADAAAGRPPCRHIGIDTLDLFLEKLIRFLTVEYNKDRPADKKVGLVTDLDYGRGWKIVRDGLARMLDGLVTAGYGVTMTVHMKSTPITDKSGNVIGVVHSPATASNIQEKLNAMCSVEGTFVRREVSEFREEKHIVPGTKIERVRTVESGKRTEFLLSMQAGTRVATASERLIEDSKIPYLGYLDPEIVLPPGQGWATWEAQYNEAIEQIKAEKKQGDSISDQEQ